MSLGGESRQQSPFQLSPGYGGTGNREQGRVGGDNMDFQNWANAQRSSYTGPPQYDPGMQTGKQPGLMISSYQDMGTHGGSGAEDQVRLQQNTMQNQMLKVNNGVANGAFSQPQAGSTCPTCGSPMNKGLGSLKQY